MTILCYPNCSTCKKALKWLNEKGIAYTYRNIQTQNPTFEELALWHSQSNLPLKSFFNTSGQSYRGANLKEKLPQMNEEEQLRLLAGDGMLVKRPLVIDEHLTLVGFKEYQWAEKLIK